MAANVAVRLGNPERDELIADAETSLTGAQAVTLRSEMGFVNARAAWAQGDLDRAEKAAREVLTVSADDGSSVLHLCHIRALALELLGLIAGDRERFGEASAHFRVALAELDCAAWQDEWTAAWIPVNLAVLARDFPHAVNSQFLSGRIERSRWVADLVPAQFLCLHGLGWCRAHEGDHIGALRAFHSAAELMPSSPLRILAWADHAMLGREVGSYASAAATALHAAELEAETDWSAVRGGDHFALLFLVEALAPIDVRLARRALNQYYAVGSPSDTLVSGDVSRGNVRAHALELRAEAAVARADGLAARAGTLFREEYDIWRRLGSEPRAAIAALDAYDLDRDPALVAFAREAASATPHSWVARRVAAFS
jgi:tetratricopeptide (TPR) repeat protein